MATEMHSALIPPKGVWWLPAGKQERRWVAIAFVWCMVLFAMMPLWHIRGGQNPTGVRGKVDPMAFYARTQRFIEDYQIVDEAGEPVAINGIPVVEPPAGSDVYLVGGGWRWSPALRLREDATYTLHLSSIDFNHGFSLWPQNVNIQVIPGYDYALKVTPNDVGDFRVICNEFCGIGHHEMLGRIEVLPAGTPFARTKADVAREQAAAAAAAPVTETAAAEGGAQ